MNETPPLSAHQPFPGWRLGLLIRLYEICWHVLLPVILLYFWRKGAKEHQYRQYWGERFGSVNCTLKRPVWVHSASMGEMRGAAPWIRALLEQGFPVFLTTLTPAGRQTAKQLFAAAMTEGRLQMAYLPLELSWAVKRFLKRVQPRCGVMTEIDTWPVLLATASKQGLPLAMANAQYPKASFERDQSGFGVRSRLFRAYSLVMCKSHLHAERFRRVGCPRVEIVGETRFDLPVASNLLARAIDTVADASLRDRPVVCFASAIAGEDDIFIRAMRLIQVLLAQGNRQPPLFVYVPRSPQHFDTAANLISRAGLHLIRRSQVLDADMRWIQPPTWDGVDVLLGDSLGEMYFYLGLSNVVVVGSSFGDKAVHNIIEPLAIKKPVWTGPSVRGIEYPALEALEAGVLHHAKNSEDLAEQISRVLTSPATYSLLLSKTEHFNGEHAGSAAKHMAVFVPWLEKRVCP